MKQSSEAKHLFLARSLREALGRTSRRQAREAKFERELVDLFSGSGTFVRRQVDCGLAGRADVVTDDAIYELKVELNRRTLQQAMGQLMLYRPHINPSARLVIACLYSRVEHLHEKARLSGFDILLCDPPYFTREDF